MRYAIKGQSQLFMAQTAAASSHPQTLAVHGHLFPTPGTEEQALEELKALLQQRLAEAQCGELSSRNITQIGSEAADSRQP